MNYAQYDLQQLSRLARRRRPPIKQRITSVIRAFVILYTKGLP